MPSPPRALDTAIPAGRAERLGWLLLIPLGCLVLGQALLAQQGIIPVLDGALGDPDAYMRLNRVLHLHASGEWFDSTYPRINPPDGHVQHWTRPLDVLLLLGSLLLQPFLEFRTGLHVWGVLFSPVCLALSILALSWASAPVLDRDARMIACLLLLLQSGVVAYSSLGRPDHHSLLFLLFILLLGLTGRLLLHEGTRWTAIAAGAVAALGLWVSTEALLVLAGALAALGLYWLGGDRVMALHSARLTAWTTAFLALALLLERGPDAMTAVETDRLSILHIALTGAITLFWAAVAALGDNVDASLLRRLLSATAGAAGVVVVLAVLFPEVRQGPLGEVDPLYKELRFERILEVQPIVGLDQMAAGEFGTISRRVIQGLGLAFLALPFLALLLLPRNDRRHRFWVGLAVPLAIFLPLAVYQIRWSGYAQILLVIPYAALIGFGVAWIATTGLPEKWRIIARSLATVFALFWPVAALAALPRQHIEIADRACPLPQIAQVLGDLGDASPGTVLALADYGPELLYRTPHRVLSIPNHRPQPGFTSTYRILSASDEGGARAQLVESSVDWILLCPSRTERSLFDASGTDATLYRLLVEGEPPAGFHSIDLPEAIRERALLFAVRLGAVGSPLEPAD